MAKTGLGLRSAHYAEVLTKNPPVPWFEIITENFLGAGGYPRSVLEKVRRNYPIAFHGVSLSIGSLDPLDQNYLIALKKMVDEFEPWLVSDHLSWSRHQSIQTHDLLPILYTNENLARIANRVAQVQDVLQRQLVLENPPLYVWSTEHEMGEGEFISQLAKMTGCGILLDLNNLVVNQHNLGADPQAYLAHIADVDVRQFHVAGHTIQENIRIDTHDQPPLPETIELLKLAAQMWPDARPLLEWDDRLPEFSQLLGMAHEIDRSLDHPIKWRAPALPTSGRVNGPLFKQPTADCAPPEGDGSELARRHPGSHPFYSALPEYYDRFLDLIFSPDGVPESVTWQEWISRFGSSGRGFSVYNSGFLLRALSALENIFPRLKLVCGEAFAAIVRDYLQKHKPTAHTIDSIGRKLPEFLLGYDISEELGAPREFLSELAGFENARNEVFWASDEPTLSVQELSRFKPEQWAEQRFRRVDACRILRFAFNTREIVSALDHKLDPPPPDLMNDFVVVTRDHEAIRMAPLGELEFSLLTRLQIPMTLTDLFTQATGDLEQSEILKSLHNIVSRKLLMPI